MHILLTRNILTIILIALLGMIIYSNILHAPFIFDDFNNIITNPYIEKLSNAPMIFARYSTRFLGYFSFSINYHLTQYDVWSYHAVNIFIHVFTSILVYFLTLSLYHISSKTDTGQNQGNAAQYALFASLIFLCHPLQTQAVTYIIQRITSLCALFYIAALLCYIQSRLKQNVWLYSLSLILTVAAMLTKEISFTLPFMILLCELMFFQPRSGFSKKLQPLWPFLLTLLIIPVLLWQSLSQRVEIASVTAVAENISRREYFLTQINVITTYLRLLIFPVGQNLDYDYPITSSLWQGTTAISAVLIIGLITFAIKIRRFDRMMAFGIFWFFLSLSVESSIIPINDVIQEHRLYLPMLGFAVFTVQAVNLIFPKPLLQRLVLIGLVIMYSVLTYQRNTLWSDSGRIWRDTIRQSPHKERAHLNLGTFYLHEKKLSLARHHLLLSLALKKNSDAYQNLGSLYLLKKEPAQSINYFKLALKHSAQEKASIYNNLGVAYHLQTDTAAAKEHFRKAITLEQWQIPARNNLADLLAGEGDLPGAIAIHEEILRISPGHHDSFLKLTRLLFDAGQRDKALQGTTGILQKSRDPGVLVNTAGILALKGESKAALEFYEKALKLKPKNINTYIEFGKFLGNLEQFDLAITIWRQGQQIAPDDQRFEDLIIRAQQLISQKSPP